MWISSKVLEWFAISKTSIDDLREENGRLRTANALIAEQKATTDANFNWLTHRVNQLEVERAQLLEKAYGIKTAVPEIARRPSQPMSFDQALFEDIGDEKAKELGIPTFN